VPGGRDCDENKSKPKIYDLEAIRNQESNENSLLIRTIDLGSPCRSMAMDEPQIAHLSSNAIRMMDFVSKPRRNVKIEFVGDTWLWKVLRGPVQCVNAINKINNFYYNPYQINYFVLIISHTFHSMKVKYEGIFKVISWKSVQLRIVWLNWCDFTAVVSSNMRPGVYEVITACCATWLSCFSTLI